jgi:hypothetical protein
MHRARVYLILFEQIKSLSHPSARVAVALFGGGELLIRMHTRGLL